ncbi:MAG: hypothetical protein SPK00_10365, partial [Corynebacterium glucuronolyticum]|nr:hypothetical protein [Mycobacteriaceae bacterium]MDY5835128.1 hypothetical protein [Corynebacterium glucuronolyticum]
IAAESASTKNRVWYSSTAPGSTRGERPGDTWFQYSGNTVVGQWRWTGSSWAAQTIGDQVIANLDAAKITGGIIDARHIGAESIDASKIKADSITVKELRANTVIPIGASLIASEPRTPDGPPEPVWWYMDNGGRAIYSFNGKGQYVALSRAIDAQATYSPPRRLVKVQKNTLYRLQIELWASKPGSKLYIEMQDQNGAHAVEKGTITDRSLAGGSWKDGIVVQDSVYDRSGANYLVDNLTVPTSPTRITAIIKFKEGVEYATLGNFYFNHKNSSVKCVQRIGEFTLEPDYASYNTVMDRMFDLSTYSSGKAEYEAKVEGLGHLKHCMNIGGSYIVADKGFEEYATVERSFRPSIKVNGAWYGSLAWKATSSEGEVNVGFAEFRNGRVDVKTGGSYYENTREIRPSYYFRDGGYVCLDVYVATYRLPDGSTPSIPSFPKELLPDSRYRHV